MRETGDMPDQAKSVETVWMPSAQAVSLFGQDLWRIRILLYVCSSKTRLTRSIVLPIPQAVQATERVAALDLTHDFTTAGKDEPAPQSMP